MATTDQNKLQTWGANAADQIVGAAIHGAGPLKGAAVLADEYLAQYRDREKAISKLVAGHIRLAAVSGFVTGLGGVVTLPVTVPAALAGLYVLGARMSAGIAHLRGYDVESEEVRTAVLLSLLGGGGVDLLKRAGIEVGRKTTAAALRRIPGRVLIEINKKVGFRLVTKAGEKGVVNLAKLVPLVGAPIGAAFDGVGCKAIATVALRIFEPLEPLGPGDAVVIDGDAVVVDGEVVESFDVLVEESRGLPGPDRGADR